MRIGPKESVDFKTENFSGYPPPKLLKVKIFSLTQYIPHSAFANYYFMYKVKKK